jgi:hypothetical protein
MKLLKLGRISLISLVLPSCEKPENSIKSSEIKPSLTTSAGQSAGHSQASEPEPNSTISEQITDWRKELATLKLAYTGMRLQSEIERFYVDCIGKLPLQEACDVILEADVGAGRKFPLACLLERLSKEDPDFGYAWAKKHEKELFDETLIGRLGALIGINNLEKGISFVANASPDEVRWRAGLLEGISQEHPELVSTLLRTDSESAQTSDIKSALNGLRGSNSYDFAVPLLDKLTSDTSREEAVRMILRDWAVYDGNSAVTYILTQNESIREFGLPSVFRNWAETAPKEAGTALLKITSPEDRSLALKGFIPVLKRLSPAEAVEFEALADNAN